VLLRLKAFQLMQQLPQRLPLQPLQPLLLPLQELPLQSLP
jgi:hypothetical protein